MTMKYTKEHLGSPAVVLCGTTRNEVLHEGEIIAISVDGEFVKIRFPGAIWGFVDRWHQSDRTRLVDAAIAQRIIRAEQEAADFAHGDWRH